MTLCGEMAGRPRCFLPLFGMGLREYSMSPAFVPTIKAVVRTMKGHEAREIAEQVLQMRTVAEIKTYLSDRLKAVCPNIAMLDTLQ